MVNSMAPHTAAHEFLTLIYDVEMFNNILQKCTFILLANFIQLIHVVWEDMTPGMMTIAIGTDWCYIPKIKFD